MARTVGILAAIVLALSVTDAQRASTSPTTADGALIANERALLDAVAKSDKAAYVTLVLPEGVWGTSQGFIPLSLLAGGLESIRLTKWDIVNPHVTWLDKDSAVVVYTLEAAGTFQNQALSHFTLTSTAWTRRNGKWLAAHHQETGLVQ
jgi:hypothetical protein